MGSFFELKCIPDLILLKFFSATVLGLFRLIAFDSTVSNVLYLCYQMVVGIVYLSANLGNVTGRDFVSPVTNTYL